MSADSLVEQFLDGVQSRNSWSHEQRRLLAGLVHRLTELVELNPDPDDLRLVTQSMEELVEATKIFLPWRDRPKLTVFGSARVDANNPLYELAREFCQRMAQRGWMTVSGAGPGIMEAAALGAGRPNTLGVNISLPFEQCSNPYVDADSQLVEMKYFFTRKVALTKASHAFAVFPGGLGTMDEIFEVLTLLHTGKSQPAPVLLIDTPDGTFWESWLHFVDEAIVARHYLDAATTRMFEICHSLEAATEAIECFYRNYVSFTAHANRGRIVVRAALEHGRVAELGGRLAQFNGEGGYRVEDPRTLSFDFDGRDYVSLRELIDELNSWVP